ncbi:tRNA modification GTPase [Pontimicrobium sp. SW4]|uniref:tRNA modification GTPase n=1 Tax=Pontimicrobium sp. SW4 TaxID=3153519 RepID=A0AAU7BQA3_9FLAO
MKKNLLVFLITIMTINCYSQISFERGHFINNNNLKVDCFIKNSDWLNNPTEFEYKLSENSEVKIINITSIKEFEIYEISKYVKHTVNIDRSTENFNLMTNNRNPEFVEEELFLKVLVEGVANLYYYGKGNLKRFFYNKEGENIEQLVYKSYRTNDNKLGKNTQYKQQLWNNLKCSTVEIKKIESLEYRKNDLIKFFSEYNICNNSTFTNYEQNKSKDLFNLTIRPRLKSSSLIIHNKASEQYDTNFGNKLGLGLGIETEFILPFNKNKWAILIEAAYQNYQSDVLTVNKQIILNQLSAKVNYSSIEVPIGLRHYFFLNENSKIFANVSMVFDVNFESNITITRLDNDTVVNDLDFETQSNLAFGLGYKLDDTYSIELRLQTSRDIFGNYVYWFSEYKAFSVVFGYSFF